MKNKLFVLFLLFLCGFGAWTIQRAHAQVPAGTTRKTVESDNTGNFLWPTNSGVSSNQWKFTVAPTHAQHLVRYQDLTNGVVASVLTNGSIPMGAALNFGNNKGTNMANGTAAQDAATYGQVTNAATGTSNALLAANNIWTGSSNTFTNSVYAKIIFSSSDLTVGGILTIIGNAVLSNNFQVFGIVTNYGPVVSTNTVVDRTSLAVGTNAIYADEYGISPSFYSGGKFRLGADGATYTQMCYTNLPMNPPSIGGNSSWTTNMVWDDVFTNSFITINSSALTDSIVLRSCCTNNNLLTVNVMNTSAGPIDPPAETVRVNSITP